MTDKSRASTMCNQVLRVVKESNLNYLVKETPYTAYVTIRKTFVKDRGPEEAIKDTPLVHNVALSDIALRQENIFLKQKFTGLESDKAHLEINIEELVQKLDEMTARNNTLNEKVDLFEADQNRVIIRLEVTKGQLDNEIEKLEKEVEVGKALAAKLKEKETKHSTLEKKSKDMNDDIIMLEHTLKNREAEIESLNQIITKKSEKDNFICDECSFSYLSETELKSHMQSDHKHHCSFCNLTFDGQKKLKSHMCRINIENPTSYWFYTKDWFERDKCIRIFDNNAKEEVVIIHSEDCIKHNTCLELPENFQKQKYFKDSCGMLHLTTHYMTENRIKWEELFMMKSTIIDQGFDPAGWK